MRAERIPGRRRLVGVVAALTLLAALPTPVLGADTTAPTTTAPKVTFRAGVAMDAPGDAPRLRIRITWTGSDEAGGTGIATYELSKSTDGGTVWTSLSKTLTSTSATTTIFSPVEGLVLLKNLRYRVRAVDKAGNVGPWATGPNLRPRLIDDRNPALVYSGAWSKFDRNAVQGTLQLGFGGASVSYTFTGRAAVLLTYKDGWADGPISIYADGTLLSSPDLTTGIPGYFFQAWAVSWSKAGTHTIKIVVNAGEKFWFDGLALTDNAAHPLTEGGLPTTDTDAAVRGDGRPSAGGLGSAGWLVVLLALLVSRRPLRRREYRA